MAAALAMSLPEACRVNGQTTGSSAVRSPNEIQAAVAALGKKDVAWRQVEWKTCLLDGLAESARTKKPLMLWIFIDRPIDDERC